MNATLEHYPALQSKSVEELLRGINNLPSPLRTAVRKSGGGHANHSLFWQVMGPGAGGTPTGAVADAIKASFGSFTNFEDRFSKAAIDLFGSGWAWVLEHNGQLSIETTPNQDSPLMEGKTPLLGLDVWEHAYYLKYQNRRADYVHAWWNVVNWAAINRRFAHEAVSAASQ